MINRKTFLMSAAMLAVVNIFLRCVALSFNAYVSAKIGSESMGLFTLVMSVYGLAVTLATSGVNLAAVRLTAERTAFLADTGAESRVYRKTVRGVMLSCSVYSLAFGLTTGTLLYLASPFIGSHLLGDTRTVLSLKVLALSLPAISLTSAMSGCFTGLRKVYKNALSSIIEQSVKIIIISGALSVSIPTLMDRVEFACLAVVGGGAVAEGMSLAVNIVMYIFDNKRPTGAKHCKGKGRVRTTHIRDTAAVSLPVAVGAYARQGLSTAEHLTIPWGMKKSGLSPSSALSAYGNLHGMAFPLILFPSAVLSSAAGLLVPELAEMRALNRRDATERLIKTVFSYTAFFSIGCAMVFFFFGDSLGSSVYKSAEVGKMIKLCAPLVPIMYTDMVVDCMLKGLGEQLASMKINIIDSASSLVLVVALVPLFGVDGYIVSVYFCEILNFTLSFIHLKRASGIKLYPAAFAVVPLSVGCVSIVILRLFSHILPLEGNMLVVFFSLIYITVSVICTCRASKQEKVAVNIQK